MNIYIRGHVELVIPAKIYDIRVMFRFAGEMESALKVDREFTAMSRFQLNSMQVSS